MKTYSSILKKTFTNSKNWNYYSNADNLSSELPVNEVESKDFLKKFIQVSGKAETELFHQIDLIGDRATHVVSTFLLGHYLYQNTIMKEKIDNEINELKNSCGLRGSNIKIEFSYLWFLTCLFHDLGYSIENEKKPKYNAFADLKSDTTQLKQVNGVPELYRDICEKYFDYRIKSSNKNDHGIVASHLLYSSLCCIRIYSENKASDLYWGKELDDIYNFCSWNILAHNIWYCKESDTHLANLYRENGLEHLILRENDYKIKLNDHPFLFLFCLIDTIEPFKRIKNVTKLKKVSIEVLNKSVIKITTKLDCECHNVIINQAKSLNDWLLKVKCEGQIVEIDLGHE